MVSNKIGIYGGTFNPIHYGHLRSAEEIYETLSLKKIIFIPSGKTPFDKPALEKSHHRYEMVKRAIRGNRHFTLSDIEVKARGKSFTVETVRKLKAEFPRNDFCFIAGIDAFNDLPFWKHPDMLVTLVDFVVISRPGYRFVDLSSSPYLRGVSKRVLRDLDHKTGSTFTYDFSGDKKVILCNVTDLNISASSIRNAIKDGRNIKYLLPDSVKFYIISHNLYKNPLCRKGESP